MCYIKCLPICSAVKGCLDTNAFKCYVQNHNLVSLTNLLYSELHVHRFFYIWKFEWVGEQTSEPFLIQSCTLPLHPTDPVNYHSNILSLIRASWVSFTVLPVGPGLQIAHHDNASDQPNLARGHYSASCWFTVPRTDCNHWFAGLLQCQYHTTAGYISSTRIWSSTVLCFSDVLSSKMNFSYWGVLGQK